jgi:DNA-binding response OmpR family regulator
MTDESGILRCGPVQLDVEARMLDRGAEQFHLTPKECRLLEAFMRYRGQVLTRQFLMKEVWLTDFVADTRTLEVHVHWLRKKLDRDGPVFIRTVRGVGYVLRLEPAEERPSPE